MSVRRDDRGRRVTAFSTTDRRWHRGQIVTRELDDLGTVEVRTAAGDLLRVTSLYYLFGTPRPEANLPGCGDHCAA